MTTTMSKEELIAGVEAAGRETLACFEGPGQTSTARVGEWGPWEVLAHFLYWHDATAWGISSAVADGPAWKLSGTADEINAACLPLHQGETYDQLIAQLRAQERLVRAARSAADLDAAAFQRPDGTTVTIGERLQTIARHWTGHLRSLQSWQ